MKFIDPKVQRVQGNLVHLSMIESNRKTAHRNILELWRVGGGGNAAK